MFGLAQVVDKSDYYRALLLRRNSYNSVGKFAKNGEDLLAYKCIIDRYSQIYIIYKSNEPVATAAITLSSCMHLLLGDDRYKSFLPERAIFIHSLCVIKNERSVFMLKFIFAKIFECLIVSQHEYIAIMADKTLAHRTGPRSQRKPGLVPRCRPVPPVRRKWR